MDFVNPNTGNRNQPLLKAPIDLLRTSLYLKKKVYLLCFLKPMSLKYVFSHNLSYYILKMSM